ncbi:hypothetical protein ACEJ30_003577 [Klebsiella oxytoca]|uniref:hypothetical protein n=1 Tax=Klebsiella oxytoca TaxID=571 RepID=UPI000F7108F7|nr:hypothetical protein [Klebsiella oxytoca]EIX9048071.1 hypothetical protein [Klebsiella oxytoca]EKK0461901.1 hypothetical protein [Klebsiella oxytoca]ELI8947788.1 hypothetical protein [Klebsiella oxytoca]VEF67319.1 Uncharacterised protein [Klebsiella oxytoca]VGO83713.1 hypothetical protein SB00175_00724 [Klebsiella oxytoca]
MTFPEAALRACPGLLMTFPEAALCACSGYGPTAGDEPVARLSKAQAGRVNVYLI